MKTMHIVLGVRHMGAGIVSIVFYDKWLIASAKLLRANENS